MIQTFYYQLSKVHYNKIDYKNKSYFQKTSEYKVS